MEALDELAHSLRRRLVERARDGSAGPGGVQAQAARLVENEATALDPATREVLTARIVRLATGLGPLEPLLADSSVDEVMVNGPTDVWVERRGRVERAAVQFASETELMHAIERVLAPLGRRVDEASPMCDARLPDGSRVNVVVPPLAIDGACMTIRRFRPHGFSLEDLVGNGTMPDAVAEFLVECVRARAAVLVSGGTGSGKTTTLNALSGAIPEGERIVTVEDAAELALRQSHVVRLEARPPNVEGRGEVTIRSLVRNALRMRPDRIVVGEVRGGEALDMLSALTTGHEGSLTTVHATSAQEALRRIETLALMAGVGLPHEAIRDQVGVAIELVVHQRRRPDGRREIASVAEVVRRAASIGVRELYAAGNPGRPLERPAEGRLADRLRES
ncbi:MAG TPA: CpaF family protein [Thermoleophilaceae bacterium]|nr:CpaF family protein [Thermoleophilaceae bacterium]